MSEQINKIRSSINDMIILYGLEFSTYGVSYDRHTYLKYKDLYYKEIPHKHQMTVRILKMLEEMGFPMNEVGTYLYKNMIESIISHQKEDDVNLLDNLNNMYSQFYVDIARNDLDIGIKTFHRLIIAAIERIDYKKCSSNVIGSETSSLNYAEAAYLIAKYLINLKRKESYDKVCLSKSLLIDRKGV